jgi:hypothetical protein
MVDVNELDLHFLPEWMKYMVAGCSGGKNSFSSCRGCLFEEVCHVAKSAFDKAQGKLEVV